MSKNAPKPSTEALDAYFASFEPIDVRPRTPSKPLPIPSRTVSRTRSGVRLCLESLEDREMLSVTPFGSAADNYDSALVWTPPSSGPYQTVTTELEAHATGLIPNNTNVNFGEGVNVRVYSGTNGASIVKENALITLNDAYDILHGTAENPLGTDHMNFEFPTPLLGATAIRLKQYNPSNPAQGNVWIDTPSGRTTIAIPANGTIAWNPDVAIYKITVINVHNQNDLHPLGLDGIDVRMYFSETPVDTGTLTTEVSALSQQVSDAQAALTAAQNATPAAAAINSLPWPEGTNASAKILGKLNVHPGQNLYALHVSPDGSMFVTASQDHTAKIWNAQTGALIRTLTGAGSLVMDAVWSKDGQSIWMTGYDRHVRQYKVSDGSVLWDSDDMGAITSGSAMSFDGTKLLVTMGGAQPLIIDTQTKQITQMGGSGLEYIGSPQALADGTFLVHMNTEAYNSGNKALTINPQTASIAWQSPVLPGQLSGVTMTPNGQWIVAGTDTGVLTIRRRDTGALAFTLPTQNGNISGMTVSGDGNQLFVGSGTQVAAFDLRPLANNQAPVLLTTYATSIGQSPTRMVTEGKTLLYLSGDGSASRMTALDRSGLAGYTVPNPALEAAQGTYNALQALYTQRNAQLVLTETQNGEHDAIMETIARINAAPQSVEAAVLQTTDEDHHVDAVLNLQTVGGSVRISSWQGVRPTLPGLDRTADGSLQFTGSAATLDLSQAAHLVTNVSFTVTADTGHDVTVRFLRGDEVIGSQTVQSGGTASFSDAAGITGVVVLNEEQALSAAARSFLDFFESSAGQFEAHRYAWEWWNANGYKTFPQFGGAGLAYFAQPAHSGVPDAQKWDILREAAAGRHYAAISLSDIDVQGNMNQPQTAVTHGLEKTPTGLLVNAPDWHQNGDTLRRGPSPGYLALGRFDPNAIGIIRDHTDQYSAITLTTTGGPAQITSVGYHILGGDWGLPQEYYRIVGNTVLLLPGAPGQIVVHFNGDGGQSVGVLDITNVQSGNAEDILPPEAMTIGMNVLAIRNTGPAEGVGGMLLEIPDTGRAVTPAAGNALLNIWNSGQAGGTVRVITNEGTSSAHELSFSLGAQTGRSVSINFTTPANGVLSITVVLPDGSRVVNGRTLKLQGDSDEKRVATLQADGTWKLEWKPSSYSGPTVIDNGVIDPAFTAWKQDRIAKGDTTVADPANYATAVVTWREEVAAGKGIRSQVAGTGGGDPNIVPGGNFNTVDRPGQALAFGDSLAEIAKQEQSRSLAYYWGVGTGTSVPGMTVRTDTAVGKVFLGILAAYKNGALTQQQLAWGVSSVLGISETQMMTVACDNTGMSASSLRTVFISAGYGYAFDANSTIGPSGPYIVNMHTLLSSNGYNIVLGFDTANAQQYARGEVYVRNAQGQRVSATPILVFNDTLTVDIAPKLIADLYGGQVHGDFALEIVLKDINGQPFVGTNVSPPVRIDTLKTNVGNVSTLPAGIDHNRENLILNSLQMPVAPGQWSYTMASDYHHGHSLYAVDLNLPTEDAGLPVYVAADGKVEAVDLATGMVVMRHQLPDGTVWHTTYFHMTHILESVTGISYLGIKEAGSDTNGQAAATRAAAQAEINRLIASTDPNDIAKLTFMQSAMLAKIGSEGDSTGPHLHFNVTRGSDNAPVNIFHWLDAVQPSFRFVGNVGGKPDMELRWSTDANTIVNDTERIAMMRTNTIEQHFVDGVMKDVEVPINYAYAWNPDGSVGDRVAWDSDSNGWFKWDAIANTWSTTNGHRQKWGLIDGLYQFSTF